MDKEQLKTPFLDALVEYANSNAVPFDVPAHHLGLINQDLQKYLGDMVYKLDSNAPRGLDTLAKPKGVIKEACRLLAKSLNADKAYFLINGTSSGIIAMIMNSVKANEKIILPRNIHKSVINGLILSGAIPVFIEPKIDELLEIASDTQFQAYKKAIDENKDAKAIFVINPTYFGCCTDLKKLTEYAHEFNMKVLVDEAHGAHFGYSENMPISAMEAGADMASLSFHKTVGCFTQGSVLLCKGQDLEFHEIQRTLNILNTTSPSSLIMASIDSARKYMALNGKNELLKIIELANYARKNINLIPGFFSPNKKYFLDNGSFDYDETKLIIEINHMDLTGLDLYKILKDEYNIQMELGETNVILAILTIGSKLEHINKLIEALKDVSKKYYRIDFVETRQHFKDENHILKVRPRVAYHAPHKLVLLKDSIGEISAESVMIYPPGIPVVIPGEIITSKIIDKIDFYIKKGSTLFSDYMENMISVIDKDEWEKWSDEDEK